MGIDKKAEVRRLPVSAPVARSLREQVSREIRMCGGAIATLPPEDDPVPIGERYEVVARRLGDLVRLGAKVGWEAPYPARAIELEGDEERELAIEILSALNAPARSSDFEHLDDSTQAKLVHIGVWLQVAEADRGTAQMAKTPPGLDAVRKGWLRRLARKGRSGRRGK